MSIIKRIKKFFKKYYNYLILHVYIEDTPRNREFLNYAYRCFNDPEYQPSTPNEQYFELQSEKDYYKYREQHSNIITLSWKDGRQLFYFQVWNELTDILWIANREE